MMASGMIERRQTAEEIEQEIKKLKDRVEKFGTQTPESMLVIERLQRKLDFARHKEAPKPIEKESVIEEDTLYLYGVDYMSTFDIKTYFERHASNKDSLVVSWLNDSSCKVKFESVDLCRKAYTDSALSHSGLGANQLHIGQAVVDASSADTDPRNFDAELGWKDALSF